MNTEKPNSKKTPIFTKLPQKRNFIIPKSNSKNNRKSSIKLECVAKNAENISWACNQEVVRAKSRNVDNQVNFDGQGSLKSTYTIKHSKIRNHIGAEQYFCTCTASNFDQKITTPRFYIQEAYLEDSFNKLSSSANVMEGKAFMLECEPPDGVPKVEVKWLKNNQPLKTDNLLANNANPEILESLQAIENLNKYQLINNRNLMVLSPDRKSVSGNYTCVAKNAYFEKMSENIQVQVNYWSEWSAWTHDCQIFQERAGQVLRELKEYELNKNSQSRSNSKINLPKPEKMICDQANKNLIFVRSKIRSCQNVNNNLAISPAICPESEKRLVENCYPNLSYLEKICDEKYGKFWVEDSPDPKTTKIEFIEEPLFMQEDDSSFNEMNLKTNDKNPGVQITYLPKSSLFDKFGEWSHCDVKSCKQERYSLSGSGHIEYRRCVPDANCQQTEIKGFPEQKDPDPKLISNQRQLELDIPNNQSPLLKFDSDNLVLFYIIAALSVTLIMFILGCCYCYRYCKNKRKPKCQDPPKFRQPLTLNARLLGNNGHENSSSPNFEYHTARGSNIMPINIMSANGYHTGTQGQMAINSYQVPLMRNAKTHNQSNYLENHNITNLHDLNALHDMASPMSNVNHYGNQMNNNNNYQLTNNSYGSNNYESNSTDLPNHNEIPAFAMTKKFVPNPRIISTINPNYQFGSLNPQQGTVKNMIFNTPNNSNLPIQYHNLNITNTVMPDLSNNLQHMVQPMNDANVLKQNNVVSNNINNLINNTSSSNCATNSGKSLTHNDSNNSHDKYGEQDAMFLIENSSGNGTGQTMNSVEK